ncbi:hypothetical protein KIPB_012148, partial [Kipferlia bialata]
VAGVLTKNGILAMAIHGNKSQTARNNALDGFKKGQVRALIATDIAARGIDVDSVTHVINYNMPVESETYVHRIGRTARAEREGESISFCAAPERDYLRAVEKLIRKTIPVDTDHEWHSEAARLAVGADARPPPKEQRGGRGRQMQPRAPKAQAQPMARPQQSIKRFNKEPGGERAEHHRGHQGQTGRHQPMTQGRPQTTQ